MTTQLTATPKKDTTIKVFVKLWFDYHRLLKQIAPTYETKTGLIISGMPEMFIVKMTEEQMENFLDFASAQPSPYTFIKGERVFLANIEYSERSKYVVIRLRDKKGNPYQ